MFCLEEKIEKNRNSGILN